MIFIQLILHHVNISSSKNFSRMKISAFTYQDDRIALLEFSISISASFLMNSYFLLVFSLIHLNIKPFIAHTISSPPARFPNYLLILFFQLAYIILTLQNASYLLRLLFYGTWCSMLTYKKFQCPYNRFMASKPSPHLL